MPAFVACLSFNLAAKSPEVVRRRKTHPPWLLAGLQGFEQDRVLGPERVGSDLALPRDGDGLCDLSRGLAVRISIPSTPAGMVRSCNCSGSQLLYL